MTEILAANYGAPHRPIADKGQPSIWIGAHMASALTGRLLALELSALRGLLSPRETTELDALRKIAKLARQLDGWTNRDAGIVTALRACALSV